ncbi:MAG: hypothetical protein ACREMY_34555, partial [bacterium]
MFGLGLWLKLGAILALLIGGALAMHMVAEHWRKQGDARTEARLQPQLDAANALLRAARDRAA